MEQAHIARQFIDWGKRNADWQPIIATFADLPLPQMTFCLVPTGQFMMGNAEGHADNEAPPHEQIMTTPYWIAQYPITNAQWALGVKARVVSPPRDGGLMWHSDPTMATAPVVGISWLQVVAFAKWLGCRLPTEREWEFAARGIDNWLYPWGNDWREEACVWFGNSGGKPRDIYSHPEGASWVGACHMSGNVWEWCSSAYKPYPYRIDDGRESRFDKREVARILRGGSWYYTHPSTLTTTCRSYVEAEFSTDVDGFRLVRDL